MSDAAIATIVSGAITITTLIVGLLKLKYMVDEATTRAKSVENKVDANTHTRYLL